MSEERLGSIIVAANTVAATVHTMIGDANSWKAKTPGKVATIANASRFPIDRVTGATNRQKDASQTTQAKQSHRPKARP